MNSLQTVSLSRYLIQMSGEHVSYSMIQEADMPFIQLLFSDAAAHRCKTWAVYSVGRTGPMCIYNGRESDNCSEYNTHYPWWHCRQVMKILCLLSVPTPGEVAEIQVSINDDLNHTTKAIFPAVWSSNMSSLDPNYAYVSTDKRRVLGNPNSSLQIDLNSNGDRTWHVSFLVNLTECPPGLMLLLTTGANLRKSSVKMESGEKESWGRGSTCTNLCLRVWSSEWHCSNCPVQQRNSLERILDGEVQDR